MAANLSQFVHCVVRRQTLASSLHTRSVIDCNLAVSTKRGSVAAAMVGFHFSTCWHHEHAGFIGHFSSGLLVQSILSFNKLPLKGDDPCGATWMLKGHVCGLAFGTLNSVATGGGGPMHSGGFRNGTPSSTLDLKKESSNGPAGSFFGGKDGR